MTKRKAENAKIEKVKRDLKQLRHMSKLKFSCATALASSKLDCAAEYYKLKGKYLELIDKLDIIDKYIINSAYINGMSYISIGMVVGYSESGVKKRVREAIKKIAFYMNSNKKAD